MDNTLEEIFFWELKFRQIHFLFSAKEISSAKNKHDFGIHNNKILFPGNGMFVHHKRTIYLVEPCSVYPKKVFRI